MIYSGRKFRVMRRIFSINRRHEHFNSKTLSRKRPEITKMSLVFFNI